MKVEFTSIRHFKLVNKFVPIYAFLTKLELILISFKKCEGFNCVSVNA